MTVNPGTLPASPPAPAAPVGPTQFRAAGPLTLLIWPALDGSGVDAAVTARSGGVSTGPYASLNLSLTVGDDPARVLENRRRLAAALNARPGDFVFARQVHGAGVRIVGDADRGSGTLTVDDAIPDTDALVTTTPGVVLAILTADCVPIVLHDPVAGVLACVHAGWRGTVAGVSAAAVAAMTSLGSRPSDIIAALGPAANPARYQVGPDVHQALTQAFGPPASHFLRPDPTTPDRVLATSGLATSDPAAPDRWLLDLWAANRHALRQAGLLASQIHTTPLPTGPLSTGPTPATTDHTTPLPTGLIPTGPTSPPHPTSPGHIPAITDPTSPPDPTNPGHFFSDRAARPCGRLALVARLRQPMVVTT